MMTHSTIKYIFYTVISLLVFVSCERELQINSENAISPEQINKANIQYFLNGLYRTSTPYRDNYVFNDIRGGNYTWTALSGNNSSYGVLISGNGLDDRNSFSSSFWNYCYSNIYDANNVIKAARDLNMTTVEAEARYVRAYLYYNLVTLFGGVPLVEVNTNENIPRAEKSKIWEFILSDLDYSIQNAKDFKVTGSTTASKQSSKALKARVLLALGKKIEAADIAEQVIIETGLSVDPDYGRIFRASANSSEIIFSYANLISETNVRMSQLFWPYGTDWAGSYFVQPSSDVINKVYQDQDIRKSINIKNIVNADATFNTIVSKYEDVQPMIISRVSEMYLIMAEGRGLSTKGVESLNEIRLKRNVPSLRLEDFSNQEDFLEEVLQERRRELFSEGFLFYDLVRTNKAIQLPNIKSKDNYLMPIPGSQIILSKGVLTQNPGY